MVENMKNVTEKRKLLSLAYQNACNHQGTFLWLIRQRFLCRRVKYIWPYAIFAYICGFNCRTDLLFYMEGKWKEKRDRLIRSGVNDLKAWAVVQMMLFLNWI